MLWLTWLPFWLPWNSSALWSTHTSHHNLDPCLLHTLLNPLKLYHPSDESPSFLFPLAPHKPFLSLSSPSSLCSFPLDVHWALTQNYSNNVTNINHAWLSGCFSRAPGASFISPYFYVGPIHTLFPSYNYSILCNNNNTSPHLYAQWDPSALSFNFTLLPHNRLALSLSTTALSSFNATHPIQFTPPGQPLQLGPFTTPFPSHINNLSSATWHWVAPLPLHEKQSFASITVLGISLAALTITIFITMKTVAPHYFSRHTPKKSDPLLLGF